MTVYYVAKTGNDSDAGTYASPKLTIAAACDLADNGSGNVVEIIDSGQYDEGDIEIYTNAITVRATGSNSPIMDGDTNNNDYAFEPYISGCVFQGLHMRNYDNALVYGGLTAARSFTLSGCLGHYILGPQLIGGASTGFARVESCRIVCDQRNAFTPDNANVWFNNSVIASNSPGYGVIDSGQSKINITASFCTIIGSGLNDSSGRNYNLLNQVYNVINCIVSGSGDGINANTSTYNLVHVSGDPFIEWSSDDYDGTARSANTGEKTGNPLFKSGSTPGKASAGPAYGNVEYGTQDYSLLDASPANESGITYNNVSLDLIGVTRESTPTPGAYELKVTWTDYGTEDHMPFDPDGFTINAFHNTIENHKYAASHNPGQIPFSRAVKGPFTVRQRSTPYKSDT